MDRLARYYGDREKALDEIVYRYFDRRGRLVHNDREKAIKEIMYRYSVDRDEADEWLDDAEYEVKDRQWRDRRGSMDRIALATRLVRLARAVVGKKGEVPEAFKEQWKNKDKDGDGKTNEPKPDFLKEKEKEKGKKGSEREAMAARLARLAGTIMGPGVPDGTGPMRGTGMCPYDDEVDDELELVDDVAVATELVAMAREIAAGCEKLPEGPMRDNCEKKKKKSDD